MWKYAIIIITDVLWESALFYTSPYTDQVYALEMGEDNFYPNIA